MACHIRASSFVGSAKGSSHKSLNYVKGFWLSTQIWLIYGKLSVFWGVAVDIGKCSAYLPSGE